MLGRILRAAFAASLLASQAFAGSVSLLGAGKPPGGGACSATNLIMKSSDLTHFDWTASGLTSVTIGASDPLAGSSAFTLVEDSSTGQHQLSQNGLTSVTSGTAYIVSLYAKLGASADRDVMLLVISPDVLNVVINLTTGAQISVNNGGGVGTNFTAANAGSGWWRISYVYTPASTATINLTPRIYSQGAGGTSYAGNGSSSVRWFGPQLELAAGHTTPCTYSPT